MHYIASVICLLIACVTCEAWYNSAGYGGWSPDRRSSASRCSDTGGICIKKFQCCNRHDVCMIEDTSKMGFGMCKPSYQVLDAYSVGAKFGFKKSGSECSDSLECADQCCRPIRMGRMGTRLACGKPDDNSACIGRVYSVNDIFNGY